MRTTLDIDDDVLLAAKELAAHQNSSAGKIISQLARQTLTQTSNTQGKMRNGFELFPPSGKIVTVEFLERLEDIDQ